MQNMYEIQKRSNTDPDIWYMISLADTREWGKKVVDALNVCEDGEFRLEKVSHNN